MKEQKREFTTSSGKVVHLRPVSNRSLRDTESDVRREFEKAEKPVDPPQYEASTIGGGSKSFYHDEVSILTATDEEKEAWHKHQECLEELLTEQNERALAIAIVEGVEEEPTEDWLKYMQWRGSVMPDNPYDLKVRYVTYELLATPEDMAAFTAAIMLLSAGMEVDEAAIEAATESFRDSVRRQVGPLLEQLAETLAGRGGGELDVQSKIPEGEGGAEPGDGDERVRETDQE